MRDDLVDEVLGRDLELADARLLDFADVPERDAPVLLDDDLAADLDVEGGGLAAQPLRVELQRDALGRRENEFVGVFERAQQDADGQLAPAVDADEHAILGVELEVKP